MKNIVYSKTFYTPTGRKRIVEVREQSFGGYEVIKFSVPKDKRKFTWGTWAGNYTNKSKAIKKANSLCRK